MFQCDLIVQCCLEPVASVWNSQEINLEPVNIQQRCLSQIWAKNWRFDVQLHCKESWKRRRDKILSIYLLHPHALYTTYISKYVETTERIIIVWQLAFNCNWHQQVGNRLGNFTTIGMWKYSHHNMNISDADVAQCISYNLKPIQRSMLFCALLSWSNITQVRGWEPWYSLVWLTRSISCGWKGVHTVLLFCWITSIRVFAMKIFEGQVKYFGKYSMSLLSAM